MNEDSKLSVTDIIQEVKDSICNSYCKWFDNYCGVYKDVEEAEEHLLSEKCDGCPLNRL